MKKIVSIVCSMLIMSVILTACKKTPIDNPQPVQQELITTIRLNVTNSSGFNKSFNYKVLNGFNSSEPGIKLVEDVELLPATEYNVEVTVLNEADTPAQNITDEIISENTEHLFLHQSLPETGAGSIAFSDGNKDDNGAPFNRTVKFTTGAAGDGTLIVTLKHQPTNKNANTPDEAGGETDAQAS